MLHVHTSYEPCTPNHLRIFHHLCKSDILEQGVKVFGDTVAMHRVSHVACCICRPRTGLLTCDEFPNNKGKTLDLSFLLACSQLYREAKRTPFSSNVFSFEDSYVVEELLKRIPQAAKVRKIRFEIRIMASCHPRLWNAPLLSVPSKMFRLQSLIIHMTREFDWDYGQLISYSVDQMTPALLSLKKLRLKDVVILFECDGHHMSERIIDGSFGDEALQRMHNESLARGKRRGKYITQMIFERTPAKEVEEEECFWPRQQ